MTLASECILLNGAAEAQVLTEDGGVERRAAGGVGLGIQNQPSVGSGPVSSIECDELVRGGTVRISNLLIALFQVCLLLILVELAAGHVVDIVE